MTQTVKSGGRTVDVIALPEGFDVYRFVNQDAYWLTSRGLVPLADMDADHRAQSARWLMDNATGLILVCESAINEDIRCGENGRTLYDVFRLMNRRPKDWVAQLPLYRALVQGS